MRYFASNEQSPGVVNKKTEVGRPKTGVGSSFRTSPWSFSKGEIGAAIY